MDMEEIGKDTIVNLVELNVETWRMCLFDMWVAHICVLVMMWKGWLRGRRNGLFSPSHRSSKKRRQLLFWHMCTYKIHFCILCCVCAAPKLMRFDNETVSPASFSWGCHLKWHQYRSCIQYMIIIFMQTSDYKWEKRTNQFWLLSSRSTFSLPFSYHNGCNPWSQCLHTVSAIYCRMWMHFYVSHIYIFINQMLFFKLIFLYLWVTHCDKAAPLFNYTMQLD